MSSPSSKAPTWKAVYTVAPRPKGRSQWLRIGTAFVNRDGSYNVFLDALPVNGTLHIRDSEPKVEERTPEALSRSLLKKVAARVAPREFSGFLKTGAADAKDYKQDRAKGSQPRTSPDVASHRG